MAEELETERSDVRDDGRRPPRAVVGSHRIEEEIFGKVFDGDIVKRIWAFVRPTAPRSIGPCLRFSPSRRCSSSSR